MFIIWKIFLTLLHLLYCCLFFKLADTMVLGKCYVMQGHNGWVHLRSACCHFLGQTALVLTAPHTMPADYGGKLYSMLHGLYRSYWHLNSQRGIIVVETAKKRLRWVGFLHLISNAALIITRWQLLTRWPHIDKNKRLFSCYYPYKFVFSDSLLLCLCCAITAKFVSIYCAKSGKSSNHVAD